KIKVSEEKITFPGIKQIFRVYNKKGEFKKDILALESEPIPTNSEALLEPIMKNGKLITKLPKINEIQQFYLENIKKLPQTYKKLEQVQIFTLNVSTGLKSLTDLLRKKYQ
ncbi:MAG: hypothetical protein KAX18_14770, partial [Candidatus Lokiarchaeota archaeon]|nr:hypothetical protein [Candidatus Lokiarchaeota archaeon]